MSKKRFILLSVLLMTAVLSALPATLFGRVESVQGTFTRSTSSGEETLNAGDILWEEERLTLADGAKAVIRLAAGRVTVEGPRAFTLADLFREKGASEEKARVEYILGRLYLVTDEDETILSAGDGLSVGDRIRTGDNSYAEISVGDKILMKMDQNTTLEIKEFEEKSKGIRQTLGRLWVKAKKLVAEKFEVDTRFGTAGVRGTSFGVSLDAQRGMNVECEEGEVYLRNPEGTEVGVKAGYRRSLGSDGVISDPEPRGEEGGFDEFGPGARDGIPAEIIEEYKRLTLSAQSLIRSPDGVKIAFFLRDFNLFKTKTAALGFEDAVMDIDQLAEWVTLFQKMRGEFERLTDESLKLLTLLESRFNEEDFLVLKKKAALISRFVSEWNFPWEEYESFMKRVSLLEAKIVSETDVQNDDFSLSLLDQEVSKWEELLNISGSAVDFTRLSLNVNRFTERYKALLAEVKAIGSSSVSRQTALAAEGLMKRLERLYDALPHLQEVIAFEKRTYEQMTQVRNRIFVFKQTLEAFSAQTDSAALWIEQAVSAALTGENLLKYKAEARIWDRFIREYEALRSDFSLYEKIVREARQKGVFYTSPRIIREYDEMDRLLNNFRIKKGCCLVTMNFGQIRKELILIKNFLLTAEGRSLLS
ncbi:FecR domain-containing protein [Candidatus Mcinerneyibacteriota bacterium]|nr:FecR domain-containing protein [Candidatus Mcinerneyibacteriota bacterium]